jgi:hypothetical protein
MREPPFQQLVREIAQDSKKRSEIPVQRSRGFASSQLRGMLLANSLGGICVPFVGNV